MNNRLGEVFWDLRPSGLQEVVIVGEVVLNSPPHAANVVTVPTGPAGKTPSPGESAEKPPATCARAIPAANHSTHCCQSCGGLIVEPSLALPSCGDFSNRSMMEEAFFHDRSISTREVFQKVQF